jgi:hypothetical protein
MAADRPNVLFIMSDDLTATALSGYGKTIYRPPNILIRRAKDGRSERLLSNPAEQFPSTTAAGSKPDDDD